MPWRGPVLPAGRVVLLDEPFSALDTHLRTSMHQLLGEVRAALDPSIVMVTHDLDEAGLADRVAVLVQGRIEQFDRIGVRYAAPKTPAVARLVGGFTEVANRVEAGLHHSSLGSSALPGAVGVAGPAILLVRKKRLGLRPLEARLGTSLRPGDRPGVVFPSSDGLWAVCDRGAQENTAGVDAVVTPTLYDEATRQRVAPGGWVHADPSVAVGEARRWSSLAGTAPRVPAARLEPALGGDRG